MATSKFRHNLARLRAHLGLNQSELAGHVSVSHSTVRSIEVLTLPLSVSLAEKLEAVFGVKKEWLLANDTSAPIPELKPKREYVGWAGPWLEKKVAAHRAAEAFQILSTLKDARSLSLFDLASDKYIRQLERMFGAP